MAISRPFTAKYGGRCAALCGEPIEEGQLVHYVGEYLEHVDCDGDVGTPERPQGPPCASCWMIHAGECL